MKYIDDWEKRRARHLALWQGEILDRACVYVRAPIDGWKPEPIPEDPEERLRWWTDGEWLLKRIRDEFENTYFAGDAFPSHRLNLGPAGHAGFFAGVRHEFQSTVWFFKNESLLQEHSMPVFDENSFLYRKTLALADFLSREAAGDFIVSMPDTCGNADVLSALIGANEFLELLYDDPDYLTEALDVIQKTYMKTCEECFSLYQKNGQNGNSIGWMYTYCEGKHMQMQCDVSVMLSPEMFDQYMKKELEEQAAYLDYGVYHLDGQEQRRHLDTLLSIEGIRMIQWTSVAGQPKPITYLDSLQKIQAAGKGLLLMPSPAEVPELLQNLSARGLYLLVRAASPEEADLVMRDVERYSHE